MWKHLFMTAEGKIPYIQLIVGMLIGGLLTFGYSYFVTSKLPVVRKRLEKKKAKKVVPEPQRPKLPPLETVQDEWESEDEISDVEIPPAANSTHVTDLHDEDSDDDSDVSF